jgi:exopolysaccharide biosynthesis protein
MRNSKSRIFQCLLFLALFIFTGCATVNKSQKSFLSLENKKFLEKSFSQVLNKDISMKNYWQSSENTFYMSFTGEKIDFHIVSIIVTPEIQFSVLPTKTFISQFAHINNSTIAINGTPFDKKTLEPVGIIIQDEVLLSPPEKSYAALVIHNSNKIEIVQNQFDIKPENTKVAMGGFYTIIKDGKPFGTYQNIKDSRTAIGISSKDNIMYILVVEGEFYCKSDGLSFAECGDILLKLKVDDAIQMDGGGSTSLCIAKRNLLSYKSLRKTAINLSIVDPMN